VSERGHDTGAESAVLRFKLGDAALEVPKLGLSAIARVLCGDAVAVGAGLLALVGEAHGLLSIAATSGGRRGGVLRCALALAGRLLVMVVVVVGVGRGWGG
jgi:hypothetical protein